MSEIDRKTFGESEITQTSNAASPSIDNTKGFNVADTLVLDGPASSYSIVTAAGSKKLVKHRNGEPVVDIFTSAGSLQFLNGKTAAFHAPIILDLDGKGVETISAADSLARYDLDGDGLSDDTSWFGQTEGLLFLDRDGDGKVSNSAEFSFIGDAENAKSDLEGLRAFDSNDDGILSALDNRFGEFRIWQDKDSDGVAEAAEIFTLDAANIKSLNLTGTAVSAATKIGEVAVLNKGSYTRTDGTTMDFIDATLTYFSSATNTPDLYTRSQKFDRRPSKYAMDFANGEMRINIGPRSATVDSRSGVLGGSNLLSFKKKQFGIFTPVVLDLDGNGLDLSIYKKSRASFDMNGDGGLDDTGWISRDDGFLVIDRNNDGQINHASELGFATEGTDPSSGFAGLAALDSNEDQVIDAKDARFTELKVWIDANGNGFTESGELKSLTETGIKSISLKANHLKGSAKIGHNAILSTATFTFTNGLIGTLGNTALAYIPGSKPAETSSSQALAAQNPSSVQTDVPTLNSIEPEKEAALLASLRAGLGQSPADLWGSAQNKPNASFFGGYPISVFETPEAETDGVEAQQVLLAGLSSKATGSSQTIDDHDLTTFDLPAIRDAEPPLESTQPSGSGDVQAGVQTAFSDPALTLQNGAGETLSNSQSESAAAYDRTLIQMIQDLAAFGGNNGFDHAKLNDRSVVGLRDWFA